MSAAELIERLRKLGGSDAIAIAHPGALFVLLEAADALEAHATRIASLEARVAAAEQTLDFVARWAWRTDPPNASRKISDSDRLSCIKFHPIIKRYGKPHIELAEREASEAARLALKGTQHDRD